MFVIIVRYTKSLDEIDRLLPDHAAFLEEQYQAGYFLLSGRQVPRTGGVILARARSREVLERLLLQDPFHIAGAAEYEIVEVQPTRAAPELGVFLPAPR